jgi:tetratricopeptide (TPR) repeat protein
MRNLRRCFVPRQLLFPLAAGLLLFGVCHGVGQETITLRSGQVAQVHILSVTPSGLQVQMGAATMVQPFSNIVSVTMAPPPEFAAAQAAADSGDFQRALELDKSVLANYRGLPTDWARDAVLMQGEIYLALNQLPQAETAFQDYQTAYPNSPAAQADAGLAEVAVAKGDFTTAQTKIQPILDQALKQRNPSKADESMYGRVFYASGKIKEHAGDFAGALEDYLRAVTIFPEDRVAAANAAAAADNLRKQHTVAVQ